MSDTKCPAHDPADWRNQFCENCARLFILNNDINPHTTTSHLCIIRPTHPACPDFVPREELNDGYKTVESDTVTPT